METGILALLLVLCLLWQRRGRAALLLAAGGVLSAFVLVAVHALTARESALVQLRLNFGANPEALVASGLLLSRLLAFYRMLVTMDLFIGPSLLLFGLFALGVLVLHRAAREQKKPLRGLGMALLILWCALETGRLWSSPLPLLALIGQNSLFACLPWMAVLFLPPWRGRSLFVLGLLALALGILATPVWQGVHWGPRLLLFALPLFVIDLYQSGRARGWLFATLLALTAVQTVNSAALVTVRRLETARRNTQAEQRLGTVVVCRNQHQCADLAPLWPGREFFTAADPNALRRLLIDFRATRRDTVWLHLDAGDSLYVATFPAGKPVWPHRMTLYEAHVPYRSVWRIYELVMNRGDTLWAPLLEAEAGSEMLAGRGEKALSLQREAVALTPASAQSHHNLALILAGLGRTEEARAEVERALMINPDLTAARRLEELLSAPPATAP